MYTQRVSGKLLRINEEERQELLDRFDLNRFNVLSTSGTGKAYKNKSECSLCDKYYHKDCVGCPFKKFEMEDNSSDEPVYGCKAMLGSISPSLGLNDVLFNKDGVVIYDDSGKHESEVKNTISEIREFFESFEYTN